MSRYSFLCTLPCILIAVYASFRIEIILSRDCRTWVASSLSNSLRNQVIHFSFEIPNSFPPQSTPENACRPIKAFDIFINYSRSAFYIYASVNLSLSCYKVDILCILTSCVTISRHQCLVIVHQCCNEGINVWHRVHEVG